MTFVAAQRASELLRRFPKRSDNPRVTASISASEGSVISATLPGRWIWITSIAPGNNATAKAARARRQPAARKNQIADPYQRHFRRNVSMPNSRSAARNPLNGIQENGLETLLQ